MKTFTVTYHHTHNYGALLQTYALQQSIISMGHENVVFEYSGTPKEVSWKKKVSPKNVYLTLKRLSSCHKKAHRLLDDHFKRFHSQRLILSPVYSSMEQLRREPPKADCLITGSDQVWNLKTLREFMPARFLDFGDPDCRRISYAASIESLNYSDDEKQMVCQFLKKFNAVSLREESARKYIESISGIKAERVLDPVFLLTKDEWLSIAQKPRIQGPYILCYQVQRNKKMVEIANKIKKLTGYPIVSICIAPYKWFHADHVFFDVSPEEFLGLYSQASVVVSASFHGTAFGVLFEKPTFGLSKSQRSNRIRDLLHTFSLDGYCMIEDEEEPDVSGATAVIHTASIIERERKKSLAYLRTCLGDTVPQTERIEPEIKKHTSIVQVTAENNCCGCGSCIGQCPKKLIEMKENNRGFLSAYLTDETACVNCGKCSNVCPVLNTGITKEMGKKAWYGHADNEELLKKSSSGAVFGMLASRLLKQGWSVYGAVMDMKTGDVHHAGTDESNLENMLMSKYVQSDAFSKYPEVKEKLMNGYNVLFCGTPCQIYGLKQFIGNAEYTGKLLTMDFFCHGVPSRKLFRDYFKALKAKSGGDISSYEFRSKHGNWPSMRVQYSVKGKNKRVPRSLDAFSSLYMSNHTLNRACMDCPFREHHFADISMGDFWEWEKVQPPITDYKQGLSMVIANTDAGIEAFREALSDGIFHEMDISYAEYAYKRKKNTESMRNKVDRFYDDYEQKRYDGVYQKYASHLLLRKMKKKLHL